MQTFNKDSIVLEFTLYFLCPGIEDNGWDEKKIAERVSLFGPLQRKLIGEVLLAIVSDDALTSWHPHAYFGLKWWQ